MPGNDSSLEDALSSNTGISRRKLLIAGGLVGSGAVGTGVYLIGSGSEPSPPDGTGSPETHDIDDAPSTAVEAADGQDFIYNTAAEMEAIREKVRAGEDPWATAFEALEDGAGTAMNMTPRSVVDNTDNEYPTHRFVARLHERDDYRALNQMGDGVLDLGLMYYFTGRNRYAEGAIDLLHYWCLAPETYMDPNGDALNVGPELRLHILTPKLWWGASFLRNHPYWNDVEPAMPWTDDTAENGEEAFQAWVRQLMESMPPAGYTMRDNHWSWRLSFYSSAAAYLNEVELLDRIFSVWRAETDVPKGHTVLNLEQGEEYYTDKDRPWNDYTKQTADAGYMKQELSREEAYFYTVFNLQALSLTAEVARVRGLDLYSFNAPTDPGEGSTMKKLFNFMAPYAKNPGSWEWGNGPEGIQSGDRQRCKTLFELAASRWPEFEEAVVNGGPQRPFSSYYIMRHPTLTHANRSKLSLNE